jgi:fatty acid desaturase
MAYGATFLPWKALVPVAWVLGGAANCNLQLAMHEISHNLAFKATTPLGLALNRALSIVANLPLGIPAAISFRKYHMEHHRYQVTAALLGHTPARDSLWPQRPRFRRNAQRLPHT